MKYEYEACLKQITLVTNNCLQHPLTYEKMEETLKGHHAFRKLINSGLRR